MLALAACFILLAGCRQLERLSFIRPDASRGEFTKIAPRYEVSDSGQKALPAAAESLVASAVSQYNAGNYNEAGQFARQALKADPQLADAHAILALLAERTGNSAEAGGHYLKAATLSPGVGIHANNYGTWLCANGRAAESLAWFDRALADPNYPTRSAAFANAGTCAGRAGQADRAETNWRNALALDSNDVQSLAGMASLQFARGGYLDARAFVERWLALAPSDTEALRLGSQIEQKLGDSAAAQRYLSRLQAISPDSTTAPRSQ
ncbi:type IV pilus biogenesis/stability protein PilW [Thermomonas sp. HDW16]|uniref:type IV pilus biogenesis/stability protein PilW n=1 Tax=Thermomonas sp. HDW16 TaxID=2714945 RepID=UPI00197F7C14|nr:type IV pilus biogenesis/stability protein PilW [Thermomonas sp. HDW16]